MERYMYYCMNCFFLASSEGAVSDEICPKCGRKLYQTGYPRESWITKSDDEKEQLKDTWVKEYEMDLEKNENLSKMLISSGFNFEGYKIVKYSGYISGDDAIQVDRGTSILGWATSNTGDNLTNSLVKIRRQALNELKQAAYDLGCNAVIGVDFDYITLEPETASISGKTTYLPYVFCVTANGNAVVIEKTDETPSLVETIKGYKELLDNGAITLEEYNKLKGQII